MAVDSLPPAPPGGRPAWPVNPSLDEVTAHLVDIWLPESVPDALAARLMASAVCRPHATWRASMLALPLQCAVVHTVQWRLGNGDAGLRTVSPACVSEDVAWGLATAQLMALARHLRLARLVVGYPDLRWADLAVGLAPPTEAASPFWRAARQLMTDLPRVSVQLLKPEHSAPVPSSTPPSASPNATP